MSKKNNNKSKNKNRVLVGLLILVAMVVAAAVAIGLTNKNSATVVAPQKKSVPLEVTAQKADVAPKPKVVTIATQWQWQDIETNEDSSNDVTLPFTPQSVYDALQAVKLDESGNVILDHFALLSLDETLERIYKKLDGASLQELQELIIQALPGVAGEQTAKLVGDYSRFLGAKDEFSQVYEGADNPNIKQTVKTIEKDQALYAELQALREVHLGSDTTSRLFEVSDANAKYMFESLKLGLEENLSADELKRRRAALDVQFQELQRITEKAER